MGKQIALGSILGAIVLFVWSAIAWMLIPWPGEPLARFTNEDAVTLAITANVPRSGNYFLPNMVKRTPGMTDQQYAAAQKAMEDRMTHGPMVFAAVRLEPFGSMAKPLVIQFAYADQWSFPVGSLCFRRGHWSDHFCGRSRR
jgi:hypothetical protein